MKSNTHSSRDLRFDNVYLSLIITLPLLLSNWLDKLEGYNTSQLIDTWVYTSVHDIGSEQYD